MSVALGQDAILLAGNCGPEEAEALLALIQDNQSLPVDLTALEWAHTALWQVLLAFSPPTRGRPSHAFIQQWLLPLVTRDKTDRTAS